MPNATTPTTEITLLEPTDLLAGEADVDETLPDEAVAEVNRIHTARAIGTYAVQVFFAGDLDTFGQRERGHATFRVPAQRDDLQVAHATIWRRRRS